MEFHRERFIPDRQKRGVLTNGRTVGIVLLYGVLITMDLVHQTENWVVNETRVGTKLMTKYRAAYNTLN